MQAGFTTDQMESGEKIDSRLRLDASLIFISRLYVSTNSIRCTKTSLLLEL
jgi:hypothetical protein